MHCHNKVCKEGRRQGDSLFQEKPCIVNFDLEKLNTRIRIIYIIIFQVIEGCTVTDIGTEDYTYGTKTINTVTTSHGTIKTNVVINCTGAWANRITNMVM